MDVRTDLGMVFQEGALFDSLTVAENVGYKLYEETDLPLDEVRARVEEVLGFVGLSEHIDKMPSELSGGQRRRVAIARAMSSKPTHPAVRRADDRTRSDHGDTVDDEIIKLRDLENVSSIVVTHQLRDAFYHRHARSESAATAARLDIVPARTRRSTRPSSSCCATARCPSKGTRTNCAARPIRI